jgi:hypothetical protein
MDWTTFSDIGTAVHTGRMKIGTRDGLKEESNKTAKCKVYRWDCNSGAPSDEWS